MTEAPACPECDAYRCRCGCSVIQHESHCMSCPVPAYAAILSHFKHRGATPDELDKVEYVVGELDYDSDYADKLYNHLTRRQWHSIGIRA